jgi:hypothetical protein
MAWFKEIPSHLMQYLLEVRLQQASPSGFLEVDFLLGLVELDLLWVDSMLDLVEVDLLRLNFSSDPSVHNPPAAYAPHTDLHIIHHHRANQNFGRRKGFICTYNYGK